VNGNPAVQSKVGYGFRVFPTPQRLTARLAAGLAARGVRHAAMLRPMDGHADAFLAALGPALASQHIATLGDVVIKRDDPEGLTRAAGELRRLGVGRVSGTTAVVIADDFRAVRHFVNALRFHRITGVVLAGDQQWRSPALVTPPEPALAGALFADFIGSYADLPAKLGTPTAASPYFAAPADVVRADFGVVGYRVGDIALRALAVTSRRASLPTALAHLPSAGSGYFPADGGAFDAARDAVWPTYLFRVADERIELEGR
jgi:hypothetical protein